MKKIEHGVSHMQLPWYEKVLIVKIVFSPLAHAKSGDDLHPVYTFKEMETVHATFRPGYHM